MSRSRFGWLVGLSMGLGFVVALLARVVHARRSELDLPPVLADDVVIDLTDDATWMAPVDGACPDGFPIKAKLSSGIFHLPGMAAYGRTHPDRCYASADDAITDGLRAAKR